jgi:disulfide bond formation protein DsbB
MNDLIARLFATRRRACAAVFIVIVGLLATSLYLQHVVGLEPCPLCILQRYAFVMVALFALVAALTPGLAGRIAHGVALLFTIVGGSTAAWHVYLQLNPPKFASCGPGLETMLTELPLARALPRIFQGSGDCSEIQWTFLGISIAGWSLVWFAIFLIALAAALRRRA